MAPVSAKISGKSAGSFACLSAVSSGRPAPAVPS